MYGLIKLAQFNTNDAINQRILAIKSENHKIKFRYTNTTNEFKFKFKFKMIVLWLAIHLDRFTVIPIHSIDRRGIYIHTSTHTLSYSLILALALVRIIQAKF